MEEEVVNFTDKGTSQGKIQITTNIYWNTFYELLNY